MLVMARKEREQIIIRTATEVITVSVDSIRGNTVRIGIDAPREVQVFRKEIDQKRNGELKFRPCKP